MTRATARAALRPGRVALVRARCPQPGGNGESESDGDGGGGP
jgi:hypothetical protein